MKMDESTTENSSTSLPDNVLKEEDSGADPTMLEENVHPLGISCTDGEIETVVVKQEIIETFDTKIEPIEDSDVTGEKKLSTNIPKDEDEQDIKQEIVWVEEMNYENDDEASAQIGGHFLDGGESSKADGSHSSRGSTNPEVKYDDRFGCYRILYSKEGKTPNLNLYEEEEIQDAGKKMFACTKCNFKCVYISKMKRHIPIHASKPVYSCTQCKFQTKQKVTLTKHLTKHKGGKLFPCTQCQFKTNVQEILDDHLKSHLKEKLFSCTLCEFKASSEDELNQHVKIHQPSSSGLEMKQSKLIKNQSTSRGMSMISFSCSICDYETVDVQDFNVHVSSHQQQQGGPYFCSRCGHKTDTLEEIDSHMALNCEFSDKNEKPVKSYLKKLTAKLCPHCNFEAEDEADFTLHLMGHVQAQRKIYSCSKCDYETKLSYQLSQHLVREHPRKMCTKCTFGTDCDEELSKHMKIHVSTKSACSECTFEADHEVDLTLHMMSVHNKPQRPKRIEHLPCNECKFVATCLADLLEHMSKLHPEKYNLSALQNRKSCTHCRYRSKNKMNLIRHMMIKHKSMQCKERFPCDECNYVARLERLLTLHKKNHHSGKSLRCEHCEYTADNASQLRYHEAVHLGKKVHTCDKCDFRTLRNSCLERHKLLHSSTEVKPYVFNGCK